MFVVSSDMMVMNQNTLLAAVIQELENINDKLIDCCNVTLSEVHIPEVENNTATITTTPSPILATTSSTTATSTSIPLAVVAPSVIVAVLAVSIITVFCIYLSR